MICRLPRSNSTVVVGHAPALEAQARGARQRDHRESQDSPLSAFCIALYIPWCGRTSPFDFMISMHSLCIYALSQSDSQCHAIAAKQRTRGSSLSASSVWGKYFSCGIFGRDCINASMRRRRCGCEFAERSSAMAKISGGLARRELD